MSRHETAEIIINRLPKGNLITAQDIASACGYSSTSFVREAIRQGKIDGLKMGGACGKYLISRDSAIRWIRTMAAQSEEIQ